MSNQSTAGRKGLSLILLIAGVCLLVGALVLDFIGSPLAFRGPMLIIGAVGIIIGATFACNVIVLTKART